MITDREYKELLEQYGFKVDYEDGYIRNDEYIGVGGDFSLISEWYGDGDVLIYDKPKIKYNKIVTVFDGVLCTSPKEFENKLQNLIKKIKNMKEHIKLLKMKEMF